MTAVVYGADKLNDKASSADDEKASPVIVQVSGADEELAENLKALLPSLRGLKCGSSHKRLDRFIDASADKLTEAAEALGYFNAQFTMSASRKKNCWVLAIEAKPGNRVTVEKLHIVFNGSGKDLPEFKRIHEEPPYQSGDILISQQYDDFKNRLTSTANSLGYFDAELTEHTIKVNVQTNKADIDLVFNTGERYHLGKVSVEQEILDDKHINRYIRLKEGDLFRSDAIIKQQRLLENSGYYKTVQVAADYQAASNKVIPVTIKAIKRKRYTYKGAIGFATNDGVYIQAGAETHWLNKKGHQLNLTSRFSEKDPAIGLNYKIPLSEPEHQYMNVSTSWSQSDNDDIRGTALKLGLDYHRRNDNDWEQIASISYLDEETKVDDGSTLSSQLTLLGLGIQKTQRNDALFPTQGWRLKAGLKGAVEGVLSDQTILQTEMGGKYLHSLKNTGKILLQGNIGSTFIGDFDEMPKSLRFFAGGQNSVRGYSFENLGERNAEGDVIGGKNLLTLSAEYEHPIMDKISAAAFIDAGNAFNDWDDYAVKFGYGVGLRYKSPLGPIRVDFAVPEEDNSDIKFYFSLGPDL